MNNEISTKDRILDSAIELFSQKGFSETPTRKLSQKSGITVSSLYNHYQSKEEILDRILQLYKEERNKQKLPDEALEQIVMSYTPYQILYKGFQNIKDATSSDKMKKIAKILLMELYRNKKVRDFYITFSLNANIEAYEKLFKKMIEKSKIKMNDVNVLASTYLAIINFFYHEYFIFKSDNRDTAELEQKIQKQIKLFVESIE
jgi:AcrR family transcriptional regulator